MNIIQKVPIKVYIGIQKKTSSKLTINIHEMYCYSLSQRKFITMGFETVYPNIDKVYAYLYKSLRSYNIQWNYTFNILCEAPRAVGMWFDACVAILLSASILAVSEKLNLISSSVHNYTVSNMMTNIDLSYKTLREYGCHLISFLNPVNPELNVSYMVGVMCHSHHPILWFMHTKNYTTWLWNTPNILNMIANFYKMPDFFGSALNIWYLPYEYGVIYKWVWNNIDIWIQQKNNNDFRTIHEEYVQQLNKNGWYGGIYKQHQMISTQEILESTSLIILKAVMQIWYYMYYILLGRSDNKYKVALLETINTLRQYVGIQLTNSSIRWDDINVCITKEHRHILAIWYNDLSAESTTLHYMSLIEGGGDMLSMMSWTKHSKYEILYNCKIDGLQYHWLQLEKSTNTKFWNSTVNRLNMYILDMVGWEKVFWSYKNLVKNKNIELLIDMVYNKIFINGTSVSAKEIHSQTALVDLLKVYKKQQWLIHNSNMIPSSYAKNKNELAGKVTKPFIRLIAERLWKNITCELVGSGKNFTVDIDLWSVQYGYLDKT